MVRGVHRVAPAPALQRDPACFCPKAIAAGHNFLIKVTALRMLRPCVALNSCPALPEVPEGAKPPGGPGWDLLATCSLLEASPSAYPWGSHICGDRFARGLAGGRAGGQTERY